MSVSWLISPLLLKLKYDWDEVKAVGQCSFSLLALNKALAKWFSGQQGTKQCIFKVSSAVFTMYGMWSNLRWFAFRRKLLDDLKLARHQVLLQASSLQKQISSSEIQPSSYKATKKKDKKLFEFQRHRDWAKSKDFIRHNSEWKWNGDSVHTFPEGWQFERSEVHFTLWTKPRNVFNGGL